MPIKFSSHLVIFFPFLINQTQNENKITRRKRNEPDGLLAGVLGLKPGLWIVIIEGLATGLPLKLLLMGLLTSEFLGLDDLLGIEEKGGFLLGDAAMDSGFFYVGE